MQHKASCPFCGQEVDWVNAATAARILDITEGRVRQLINANRFPGAVLFKPTERENAFWKIPLASVAALIESRRES